MDEVADDVRQAHRDEYHEEPSALGALIAQRIDDAIVRERAIIARYLDTALPALELRHWGISYVIREGNYPEAWA